MGTNRKELVRGLKYEGIALPLLFIGPILITMGLKAIRNEQSYLLLILGIIVAFAAIVIGFLGLRIMLNALFDKKV